MAKKITRTLTFTKAQAWAVQRESGAISKASFVFDGTPDPAKLYKLVEKESTEDIGFVYAGAYTIDKQLLVMDTKDFISAAAPKQADTATEKGE